MTPRCHIQIKNGQKLFYRFTLNQRIQHIILAVCVIVLVLTGMPLRFHDQPWAHYLYGLFGGTHGAPIVHRVAGIILVLLFIYHLGYLAWVIYHNDIKPLRDKGEWRWRMLGRVLVQQPMVPNRKDLEDLKALFKYLCFLSRERPRGDRFTWKEKFDYWAPFWGMFIIGTSGILMLNVEWTARILSGRVLNYALIAHSDEALLAALFLFIWHWYNVHFSASVFPMGSSFLTGYLTEDLMIEDHYDYYVQVMKAAGYEAEIKPPHHESAAAVAASRARRARWRRLRQAVRTGFLILSMALTLIYVVIIWNVTFGQLVDLYHQRKALVQEVQMLQKESGRAATSAFEEILGKGTERVRHYLGYRVLEEIRIEGHFHHVDMEFVRDSWSYCTKCHGDRPHDKNPELRAFCNMHAYFMACQTCHMRFDRTNQVVAYRWYDRTSGELVPSPVTTQPPGAYTAKIVPVVVEQGRLVRIDTADKRKMVEEFLAGEASLDDLERAKATKVIHQGVSDKPYGCIECHNPDQPLLPLKDLGYPDHRIAAIMRNEVVQMIREYEKFYLPTFVRPGG